MVRAAHRRAARHRTFRTGRGILAFGEAVDLVVEEQHVHVHVAAQQVDDVVAADAQRVAIAGDHPHAELGADAAQATDDGGRAAVDAVQAVGIEVVGEARGAADAADEDHILLLLAALFEQASAPASGCCSRRSRGTSALPGRWRSRPSPGLTRQSVVLMPFRSWCSWRSTKVERTARISSLVNGMPWILFKPCASTRNSPRSIWRSCPLFISGTSTFLYFFSSGPSPLLKGNMWRMCTCATLCPSCCNCSAAVRIAPYVDPQPTISNSPSAGPLSKRMGLKRSAMRATFSARKRTIFSWFAGS